jgi:hypothetical protein
MPSGVRACIRLLITYPHPHTLTTPPHTPHHTTLQAGLPFVGALSAAEPMLGPKATWWLSECVSVGAIKVGLPGLAAQVFFFSPIPVFQKIAADKDVGTLPLLPYSAMATNGILWSTYGVRLLPLPVPVTMTTSC